MNLPHGWTAGHDGSVACPHHDLYVCPDCASAHDECVEVAGQTWWITDPDKRAIISSALPDDPFDGIAS
jgi:hypothetical protein